MRIISDARAENGFHFSIHSFITFDFDSAASRKSGSRTNSATDTENAGSNNIKVVVRLVAQCKKSMLID